MLYILKLNSTYYFFSDVDKKSRDEQRTALHFAASFVPLIQEEQDCEECDNIDLPSRNLDRRCSGVKSVRCLIKNKAKVSLRKVRETCLFIEHVVLVYSLEKARVTNI